MSKKSGVFRAVFTTFCFVVLLVSFGASSTKAQSYTPLVIDKASGERLSFEVELAITNKQRQQGLMYRTELAPNKGMLFIFSGEQPRSFWMRNTYIPLDIIFLRADGSIVNIIENAEPRTDTPRPSTAPAKAVLELSGGRANDLGIKPGDVVRHALLRNVKPVQ